MSDREDPRRAWIALALLLALAFGSIALPALALPAAFLCFIAILSLPRLAPKRPALKLGLGAAVAASVVGLVLFVVNEAVPGIVQGGHSAVERKTVSRLREIRVAQNAFRRTAHFDPDGDGVGSGALLSELCGHTPLRSGERVSPPIVACKELVPLGDGLADDAGPYLHVVCLPTEPRGFSAAPNAAFDDERSERHFIAYAWPSAHSRLDKAYFIDERERILERRLPPQRAARAFRCDAVFEDPDAWTPWMGKQPLPEEPPAAAEGSSR